MITQHLFRKAIFFAQHPPFPVLVDISVGGVSKWYAIVIRRFYTCPTVAEKTDMVSNGVSKPHDKWRLF